MLAVGEHIFPLVHHVLWLNDNIKFNSWQILNIKYGDTQKHLKKRNDTLIAELLTKCMNVLLKARNVSQQHEVKI